MIGGGTFAGGPHDKRAGTVHPMGYVRGLARAALGAGCADRDGRARHRADAGEAMGWRSRRRKAPYRRVRWFWRPTPIPTTSGRALAGLHADPLFPARHRTAGRAADAILPGRQGLWDTAQIMTSLRKDVAGRLMIGSMGRVMGDARSGISRRWAERTLRRCFPISGRWRSRRRGTAMIALTPDHLPRIHVLAEGLYTPIGYNGRGITTGTVFGKAMAELLTGWTPPTCPCRSATCDRPRRTAARAALRGGLRREPDHERVGTMSDADRSASASISAAPSPTWRWSIPAGAVFGQAADRLRTARARDPRRDRRGGGRGRVALRQIGQVIHGTTLVTNALIQRRGAKTAFITTEGFRDVIEMRSENRFEQYDLNLELPAPLIAREHRSPCPSGSRRMAACFCRSTGRGRGAGERIAEGGYEAVAWA
jgi:hypothetical protein